MRVGLGYDVHKLVAVSYTHLVIGLLHIDESA